MAFDPDAGAACYPSAKTVIRKCVAAVPRSSHGGDTVRDMLIALSILVVLGTCPTPLPHIRLLDPECAAPFERGRVSSPTFNRLVATIETSDVILHVQCTQRLRPNVAGVTWLSVRAGGHRFVRVSIDRRLAGDEAVSVLGHELYHVTEIAGAPHVVDTSGMRALYMMLGHRTCSSDPPCFDTREAQEAGDRVREELRLARRSTRPRRRRT